MYVLFIWENHYMTRKGMFLPYQLKKKLKPQKLAQFYQAPPWKEKNLALNYKEMNVFLTRIMHQALSPERNFS